MRKFSLEWILPERPLMRIFTRSSGIKRKEKNGKVKNDEQFSRAYHIKNKLKSAFIYGMIYFYYLFFIIYLTAIIYHGLDITPNERNSILAILFEQLTKIIALFALMILTD
jgi:hypothetical protein